MATLNKEQFERLSKLLHSPAAKDSAEAQLLNSNPEVRAEAERLAGEYAQEQVDKVNPAKALQDVAAGPGLAMANMSHGTQNLMYGVGLTFVDLASMLVLDDESATQQNLNDARKKLSNSRKAAEVQHDVFVATQMGGQQEDGLGRFTTETAPKFLGELMPFMYLPTGLSTYWRTVGYNGVIGTTAATAFDKEAENMRERLGTMTVGGLAGMVLSGALHAPGGFRAYSARKLKKHLTSEVSAQNAALEKEIQRITGDLDFSFSLGQLTENPFISGLEVGAAKALARDAQNARIATLSDALRIRANKLSTKGEATSIAVDMRKTIEELNTLLQKRASSNYGVGMENVIKNFGDDVVIDGRHYLSEAKRLIAESTDPLLGGSQAPAFLLKQVDELDRVINPSTVERITRNGQPMFRVYQKADNLELGVFQRADEAAGFYTKFNLENGGLDAETTSKLLQSFGRIAKGQVPIFTTPAPGSAQNLSDALKKAMMESLDDTAIGNKDAVEAIKSLRKIYQTDQAQIIGYNNVLMSQLWAAPIETLSPRAALNTLAEREAPVQRAMVKILGEHNPQLLEDIRGTFMRQIVNQSSVPSAPSNLHVVNPTLLANNLAGIDKQVGGVARGLFDPKTQAHLRRTGEALRVLQQTHLTLFPEAAQSVLRDVTINAVSRSPEFFARMMTGLFSSGKTMSRVLNDPAFRDSIIQIADKGLGSTAAQGAIIYVSTTLATWNAEERAEEREKQLEKSVRLPGD